MLLRWRDEWQAQKEEYDCYHWLGSPCSRLDIHLHACYLCHVIRVCVAADGLALGAAAGLSKADVEFIIFLAIMLHKAPAAFGFTSFLIHEVFP